MVTLQKNLIKFAGVLLPLFCCTVYESFAETTTICRKGQYVAKCGSVTIGTNLLKGYVISEDSNSPNYYDYSGTRNVANLRAFFRGNEFRYTTRDGYVNTVTENDYESVRTGLLQSICDPNEHAIECKPCLDGGEVNPSRITNNGWHFYTFADCYKYSFTDSTGTYQYKNGDSAESCYYSTEIKGDTLISDSWEGIHDSTATER